MKWGYHDALLAYLLNYRRGSAEELKKAYKVSLQNLAEILAKATDWHLSVSDILTIMARYDLTQEGIFLKDLQWFLETANRAVFKRIQSPPIIVQSKAAYGFDIRESQVTRSFEGSFGSKGF